MKKIIDISEHNGQIDFYKVKQAGICDVIIRIGWIGNKENHTIDKRFNEYLNLAKANGFNIGVYVYSYCKNVETLTSGMKWMLKNLNNQKLELPVFLDLEDTQIANISKEYLTSLAKYYCDYMQMNGYTAGIYANKNWFENHLTHDKLLNYKIWWAEYNGKENATNSLKIDLWQYTSTGKVNGINGNVDISICLCKEENKENITGEKQSKEEFEVKEYVNGSTKEIVYQDANCTKQIGYLNPRETCKCYGLVNNKALIVYKIDSSNNYKTGFVNWLGGIKH